jgi:hypothetical protein
LAARRPMARPTYGTSTARRLGVLAVVLVISGCEDVDWDWELQEWRQPQRPIRPVRRSAPPDFDPRRTDVRTEPAKQAAPQQVDKDVSSPGPVAKKPEQNVQVPPVGPRTYYHLYLISRQASLKAPVNSKKIQLKQTESRPAVDLLNMIYPSIGPSGGEGQRFLVYQQELMWAAAAEFVHLIDCPVRASLPPADPTDPKEALGMGVGLFYHLREPGQPTDFDGYRRCLRSMEATYGSDRASGQLRWGSAVLAGRIAAEVLSDFPRARRYFEQAKGFALPGSVEEMIAVYFLADTRVHEGKREEAVRLAQGLVTQFAAHRASYVYERALALTKPQ